MGIETLAETLRTSTLERRKAAQEEWARHGQGYLRAPSSNGLERFAPFAPEIQMPMLAELDARIISGDSLSPVLSALSATMNAAGADRLLARIALVSHEDGSRILLDALGAGSLQGIQLAESLIASQGPLRPVGFQALLTYGEPEFLSSWLEDADTQGGEHHSLGQGLQALALRQELPEDFSLPAKFFQVTDPALQKGVLSILKVRPDRQAEELVTEIAEDALSNPELRKLALETAVLASSEFPWRRLARRLGAILRTENDPLIEEIAWTAHALGEKSGAKYLLNDLEDAVKKNPRDWRPRLRLAKRQVDLSDFSGGYKEFRRVVQLVRGSPSFARLDSEDWFYGARAACGSRHFNEGAEWLDNARMSPRQLRAYSHLPEFEDALTKSTFKKKFGLNN